MILHFRLEMLLVTGKTVIMNFYWKHQVAQVFLKNYPFPEHNWKSALN